MTTDHMQTGFGAIKSPDDYRYVNVLHLAGAPAEAATMPPSFHIDYSQVPDLYQRKIGACTCHSGAEIRMHRGIRLTGSLTRYSPRFSYTLAKIEDGLPADEQGTYVNLKFKIGVKYGFATEEVVPNDTTLPFSEYIYFRDVRNMPAAAFENAAEHRIPGYAQVGSFNNVSEAQLKQAIMRAEDGVSICMRTGKEWYTAKDGRISWAAADILPIRKCIVPESGHDVVATGWETEEGTGRCKIFFRNHWSLAWANNDTGWFYLDEHPLNEAWIISEIPDPLLAIIKSLPAQKDFTHTWATDIAPGAQNPDVRALQIALKIVGTFPYPQPVTDYFGNITKAAVMAFQSQYKVASPAEIAAANGKLGPKSRTVLNTLFSGK